MLITILYERKAAMLKNQKGFTVVEGLLIAIIVILIGGIGYYVYTQQQTNETSESVASTETTSETEESTKAEKEELATITHSKLNYSVSIPEDWTAEETNNKLDHITPYQNIVLESDDFLDTPEEGYPEIEKGAKITIYASSGDISTDINQYNDAESTYNKTASQVSVDGQQGVKYIWSYEGSPAQKVVFNKDGKGYTISMNVKYDGNTNLEEQFAKFKDEFNTVVESFKFN
jgi:type II secretory pathway pseudopilin PulG